MRQRGYIDCVRTEGVKSNDLVRERFYGDIRLGVILGVMPESSVGEEIVNPIYSGLESRPIMYVSIERFYRQLG